MKKRLRKATAFLVACVMAASATACSSSSAPSASSTTGAVAASTQTAEEKKSDGSEVSSKAENKDTLVVAVSTEPTSLDPQYNSLIAGMTIERQIYDTLVTMNPDTGEIEPCLASEWEWEDDLTLNMTLRSDVVFQNGEKMTAEDVVFTIKRLGEGSATASLYSSFDGDNTMAIDDNHVQIKFSTEYAPALRMLANTRASVVCKSYVESVGNDEMARKPMGTGAFKFEDWVTGDRITLSKNDICWNRVPSYETLAIRFVTDQTARAIELETGGVDVTMELATSDIEALQAGIDGCDVYAVGGFKQYWLGFNENDPYLSDSRVRRAIAMTLNVDQMVQAAYGISAVTMDSCLGTGLFGYKSMPTYENDLEGAKALLAEAGYPNGFDIDLVISQAAWNTKMAELINMFLGQVGINVNIQTFDGATESSMRANGEETLFIGNLTCNTADADQWFSLMLSNSTKKSDAKSDEVLNKMILDARAELDTEKRAQAYADLQQYVYDNALVIPLAQAVQYYGTRDYVEGFVPDAGLIPDFSLVNIH